MALTKKQQEIVAEYARLIRAEVSSDKEVAHARCDELLLEALRKIGLNELADAWTDVESECNGFWYA
jgi:hypothetical protein